MNDIWFEEDLLPDEKQVDQIAKDVSRTAHVKAADIREAARGRVLVNQPRWIELDPKQLQLLGTDAGERYFLVRLGFQFALPREERGRGAAFVYARCSAYLWPFEGGQPAPRVYEVIPSDLYEGKAQTINVKLGPTLKLDKLEASAGEVSTDVTFGTIEPSIVGWAGEDERSPYWELRPTTRSLIGTRHLWMIVELPSGCSGVQIATMAEGEIQTRFALVPVGPRVRTWDGRYTVVIT